MQDLITTIQKKKQFRDLEVTHDFTGAGKKTLLFSGTHFVQKAQDEELYFISIRDITEHVRTVKLIKQAEWFHELANSVPVMIWAAEGDKRTTFLNATWKDFTGLTSDQQGIDGWLDGIHPEDREEFIRIYNDAFSRKEPFSTQYRFRRYDGEYRWLLNNGVPTYNDREFSGYLGTCTDIHNQKMFAEELEENVSKRTHELVEANENFRRTNMELQQYAYVASHDLQEPLRKLQTFADILQQRYKEELPQGAWEYIQKMTACSLRMTQLIEDLLNFSSVTNVADNFEETNLNEVLSDVLEDFSLQDKPVLINTEKLPVIEAIPLHIKQLFRNLVSNAVKFREDGRDLHLEISTKEVSKENVEKYRLSKELSYFELIFKDNGSGFDPSFAEQIFVIFKRLSHKQKAEGTGIGLALCHKIAVNHNGIIYAESTGKDGASFHIILPYRQTGSR